MVAKDVGGLGADEQDALLVGFGGRDLKKGDGPPVVGSRYWTRAWLQSAWAVVEFPRHTDAHIDEMLETSHKRGTTSR
ncbi:hypothetical protein [Streptomyces canus]|uniref:hypothetical protein n=1 Tax=Streptomyces canus TaxID=58343 RepID=UPI003254B490